MLRHPRDHPVTAHCPVRVRLCQSGLRPASEPLRRPMQVSILLAGIPMVGSAVSLGIAARTTFHNAIENGQLTQPTRRAPWGPRQGTAHYMVNGKPWSVNRVLRHGSTVARTRLPLKPNASLRPSLDPDLALEPSRAIPNLSGLNLGVVDNLCSRYKQGRASPLPTNRHIRTNKPSPREWGLLQLRPPRRALMRLGWALLGRRAGVKEATSPCSTATFSQWAQTVSVVVEHLLFPRPCRARRLHSSTLLVNPASSMSWDGYSQESAVVLEA